MAKQQTIKWFEKEYQEKLGWHEYSLERLDEIKAAIKRLGQEAMTVEQWLADNPQPKTSRPNPKYFQEHAYNLRRRDEIPQEVTRLRTELKDQPAKIIQAKRAADAAKANYDAALALPDKEKRQVNKREAKPVAMIETKDGRALGSDVWEEVQTWTGDNNRATVHITDKDGVNWEFWVSAGAFKRAIGMVKSSVLEFSFFMPTPDSEWSLVRAGYGPAWGVSGGHKGNGPHQETPGLAVSYQLFDCKPITGPMHKFMGRGERYHTHTVERRVDGTMRFAHNSKLAVSDYELWIV